MVWLLPYAETARVWVIILITYIVALGDFSHVIAGSVDALYLVVTGERSFGDYLGGFLAPALLGEHYRRRGPGGGARACAICRQRTIPEPVSRHAVSARLARQHVTGCDPPGKRTFLLSSTTFTV